jgi:hypothetical protein
VRLHPYGQECQGPNNYRLENGCRMWLLRNKPVKSGVRATPDLAPLSPRSRDTVLRTLYLILIEVCLPTIPFDHTPTASRVQLQLALANLFSSLYASMRSNKNVVILLDVSPSPSLPVSMSTGERVVPFACLLVTLNRYHRESDP